MLRAALARADISWEVLGQNRVAQYRSRADVSDERGLRGLEQKGYRSV